ncbi:MAG: UTP--glucose-1-phosphate uridylyltransferase, partial [Candidatus Binatia bacterium]
MAAPAKPPEIGGRSALGEAYLAGRLAQAPLRGDFRLSRREDVRGVEEIRGPELRAAIDRGLAALRDGSVAFGILAAGASTRMDLTAMPGAARRLLERAGRREIRSKALVPVVEHGGVVLTFLDLFLVNVERFSSETASRCPMLALVSETNAEEIEAYIRAAGRIAPERVVTFRQTLDRQIIATAADVERARKNFASAADVESALELSRAYAGFDLDVPKPAGHGEFLHQLISSGTLGGLLERGIRFVSLRNIDNIGAVLDESWLAILGRLIESGESFVVEVSRRPDGPAGKGGALIVRPNGEFQLAEDPSFAGTGRDPRDSYYINN